METEIKIKYSIITPVYNRADCIGNCIESVQKQNGVDYEHIIVDDGSTDATGEILKEYEKHDSHIRVISFSRNKGVNSARNVAISVATGLYTILLDSDDCFSETALNNINSVVSKNDYIHYCFATDDMLEKYNNNELLSGKKFVLLKYEDFLLGKLWGDYVHVVRTKTLKENPFDDQLKIYEGLFFMKYYKVAKVILFSNIVCTYRERGRSDSVTKDVLKTNNEVIKKSIRANELFLRWFSNDLLNIEDGKTIITKKSKELFEDYLSLGNYDKSMQILKSIGSNGGKITFIFYLIYKFRLGRAFFYFKATYLYIRYKLFNRRMAI